MAQSKPTTDSAMLKVVHYGDDVLGDEIKAARVSNKVDYVAAAGAIAKGQQEADISVIGDKKGGYSQEIIYQPGKTSEFERSEQMHELKLKDNSMACLTSSEARVSLAPTLQPTLDSA